MNRRNFRAAVLGGVLVLAALPAWAADATADGRTHAALRLGNDDGKPKGDKPKPDKPKDDKPKDKPKDEAAKAYAVEVLVLHATNSGEGIDSKIGDMPELKKPPFSAYDSYKLLDSARLPLDKEHPQRMRLPNGRVLET